MTKREVILGCLKQRKKLCQRFISEALSESNPMDMDPATILSGLKQAHSEIEVIDSLHQELISNRPVLAFDDIIVEPSGKREDGPLSVIKQDKDDPFPEVKFDEKEREVDEIS